MNKVKLTIIADEISIDRECLEVAPKDADGWRRFAPGEDIMIRGGNMQMRHEVINILDQEEIASTDAGHQSKS